MARDPLATVLRLRRLALDEATQALAAGLAREDDAVGRVDAARAAIGRETALARNSDDDHAVEAFAAWLPVGRRTLAAAEAAQAQAAAETELARSALVLARGAVSATETLIEQRAAGHRLAAERRSQAALDEIGVRGNSRN